MIETLEHGGRTRLTFVRERAGTKNLLAEPVMPGRHEAAALTCPCECGALTAPSSVIDECPRKRQGQDGRYATYDCQRCGESWVSWWPFRLPAER